ncbi:LysM domain-containing protein [Actinomadura pelletieri DSM 43383]|uniref:LysM domain-containing protein n=1 Tax=Actinomadura pelletieri DSM 43383 TaxID=1120940 RepID=A0A495QA48_9ACTN|nr:BTAD domain-containing putative transcriptional regulator [Actinomadura pelletieri]RKS68287.1 LysM domain-containing protein [Actinomadura pelletieri DSM 43383]
MTDTGRRCFIDFLRGLSALVAFVFLLIGFPVAMYAMGGSPIPDRVPSWEEISATLMRQDTDQSVFLTTIMYVGWGAWCLFIVTVCAEVMNYLAGRSRSPMPRPVRPVQQLVRDLIATAALTFTAAASLATSASAVPHAQAATGVHVAEPEPGARQRPVPGEGTPSQGPAAPNWTPLLADEPPPTPKHDPRHRRDHIVKRGETLWSLARRTYGSGALYLKIFKSSRGIDQPAGVPALTDPDVLYPGQRIRLPRTNSPADGRTPSRTASSRPGDAEDSTGRDEASDTRAPTTPGSTSKRATASEVPSPIVAPPVDPTPGSQGEPDSPLAIPLSPGSRIGLGLAAALSVAVAATRLHRRRRRLPDTDPDPSQRTPESPIAVPVLKARKAHLDDTDAREAPIPSDEELVRKDLVATQPDDLVVGTGDGQAISVTLPGLSLGLSGDGAHAAARAITVELLAKAHRDRAAVLIPQADAQALFPGDDITHLSTALEGLIITPTLDEAIGHLETELLRRGRVLEMTDQPDVPTLRTNDPAEPLPTMLLVASVPPNKPTVQALAGLGRRHCIGVLSLGFWPSGTSVELSADATVTDAHGPDAERFTGTQLFELTTADAAGMLRTIRTATGSEPDVVPSPSTTDAAPEPEMRATSPIVPPPRPSDESVRPPVRLNVLGHVGLHTKDGPISTGLRQRARELLTYLALHPDGVTRDRASADLWPDDSPETVVAKFNTAVGNIRSVLRAATGLTEPMYVIHNAGRYHLDPDLIDIDLWQLTAALTEVRHAADDTARIKALTLVTDRYTDEFASGLTQQWAEAHREYLRHTASAAASDLARHIQEDHPEQALTVLEQAIIYDPYSEPLYQSLMRIQARLDRPEAVRRTYQLLAARLDDIDAEPDDETRKLVNLPTPTSKRN